MDMTNNGVTSLRYEMQDSGLQADRALARRIFEADTTDVEIVKILLRATQLEAPTHADVQS